MQPASLIVTGATSGLGQKTASLLAREGRFQLVLAARDVDRARAVAAELSAHARHPVLPVELELGSLRSVQTFPERLNRAGAAAPGGLICNAGLQDVSGLQRTADGFERTFGVNHVGHFALTRLLLPHMVAGARIVVVASNTHDPSTKTGMPPPEYRTAASLAHGHDGGRGAALEGKVRYTTSKLCNVLFARELVRRLLGATDDRLRSLHVAAFDPGLMPGTGLARDYHPLLRLVWSYALPVLTLVGSNVNTVGRSAARLAALFGASAPIWPSGGYFSSGVLTQPSEEALDAARALELWSGTESLVLGALDAGAAAVGQRAGASS